MPDEGGIDNGSGFNERVALGFRFLNDAVDKAAKDGNAPITLDIDVVGFSRGAAEARVWMYRLVGKLKDGEYTSAKGNRRCLNLRFEGLWDTVSHLGRFSENDKNYDFSIPLAVKYVAQAVAINEHRGGPENFHARSIFSSPSEANIAGRIELGFIGSHADIGGGYGTGDLSDVALMWIIKQGEKQGIKFKNKDIIDYGWDIVTSPIVHDKSTNNQLPDQAPLLGDRDFIYGDGTRVKQGKAAVGGKTTKWTKGYISYYYHLCGPRSSPAVGLVDMKKYSAWLLSQGVQMGYQTPAPTRLCN